MNDAELQAVQRAFDATVNKALALFRAELSQLIERVAALEAGGAKSLVDAYRGVYHQAGSYRRGELVTDRGSLHFCLRDTDTRPGESPHWQLAVKSGKDARDAR